MMWMMVPEVLEPLLRVPNVNWLGLSWLLVHLLCGCGYLDCLTPKTQRCIPWHKNGRTGGTCAHN